MLNVVMLISFQDQQNILSVENVVGIGKDFGKTCIFLDADIPEELQRKTVHHLKEILEELELKEYSLQFITKEIQKCSTIGDKIGRKIIGTLGCFAWIKMPGKDHDLCAIVSGHVARLQDDDKFMLLGIDESSKAEIWGEIILPLDEHYDISAVITKSEDRVKFLNTKFKNEKGEYVNNCTLYDFENQRRAIPYLAFLWGFVSKPGLGKIQINNVESQLLGNDIFLIRSRDENSAVGTDGDSGAIICIRNRNNEQYAVGIFIGKCLQVKTLNEPLDEGHSNYYIALALQPGLQKLSEDHQCSITLKKPETVKDMS